MFFIIAQSLAPLGDYLNKKFGNIFKINKLKLSPIMPIDDLESYGMTIPEGYSYSTQEELDDLV
jgi:hypothetical protein